MPIDAAALKAQIAHELERLSDALVKCHIRSLLVEPKPVLLDWDYGKPGEQFLCWVVLDDSASRTGIAYCESGFGPRDPWGLVWLGSEDGKHGSIGMDSAWFRIFLDAYFESFAATRVPIWRVFRTNTSGVREPITNESTWKAAWERVIEFRATDLSSRYDCDHSVAYRSALAD
jgi:hypothetical protein